MTECVCLKTCPFFNDQMADMPKLAGLLKKQYCLGDSSRCARHKVFEVLGRSSVPANLYPDNLERAEAILAGK